MQICVTRFNNKTIKENYNWKLLNAHVGCIYGTPIKISEKILPDTLIAVLEMNNTKNIIEGIGFIKNKLEKENKKYYKIYTDNNYNRFIYKSNLRIDKSSFSEYEKNIIENIEYLLFKSSKHCKRGHGIQCIPKNIKDEEFNYINFLKRLYYKRFIKITSKKIKII
tara:strand:+ start:123 stop:620 length:498 start_codon:yes stop_codon:yes gene_type:complete